MQTSSASIPQPESSCGATPLRRAASTGRRSRGRKLCSRSHRRRRKNGTKGTKLAARVQKTYAENEEVKPVSSVELAGCGDARSSITVDGGKVYFTTKGRLSVQRVGECRNGAISDLKTVSFNAQSTSTPVVFGNYVYFGAGSGISDSGSRAVSSLPIRTPLEVVNHVDMLGYPQCEMLLSTAYLKEHRLSVFLQHLQYGSRRRFAHQGQGRRCQQRPSLQSFTTQRL